MERPIDKWVCHFYLLKKKGCHYEGQYDAKSDKFINISYNEDHLQECDFEDVHEWTYVDFAMTKSLMKQHNCTPSEQFINQILWEFWNYN